LEGGQLDRCKVTIFGAKKQAGYTFVTNIIIAFYSPIQFFIEIKKQQERVGTAYENSES
jgi:hypothetical protein